MYGTGTAQGAGVGPEAKPEVLVVRTGTANLASILAGLARAGAAAGITEDAEEIRRAQRIVLPGVGSFGAAARSIEERGLTAALAERARDGRPFLAICLGMQLLASRSEEDPDQAGLSLFPVTVRRLKGEVRVPQLGWNRVHPPEGSRYLRPGHAYFANSYCLTRAPMGFGAAYSEHGERFVAALERDGLLACQFHPELSGAWGCDLLRRWLGEGG